MAFGIEVFDAAGNSLVAPATRTGFMLGSVVIGAGNQSGSASNADLARGTPFYFAGVPSTAPLAVPLVSFAGTTMTWASAGGGLFEGTLFYGIY